jgi:hypothetical protein
MPARAPAHDSTDPRRLVREYGCVRCQTRHRLGLDPEYQEHLYWQSKHGWYDRLPTAGEVFRRLVEEGAA